MKSLILYFFLTQNDVFVELNMNGKRKYYKTHALYTNKEF